MIGQLERVLAGRDRARRDLAGARHAVRTDVDLAQWRLLTRWWRLDRSLRWPAHRHDEHELLWDVEGIVAVTTGDRLWIVPPTAGLWIPAGLEHDVVASSSASFACTFVSRAAWQEAWTSPQLVAVGPLTAAAFAQYGDEGIRPDMRPRIADVALGLLEPWTDAPALPLPSDPRARVVADALLADPSDDRGLPEWARLAHSSVRTLSRRFSEQTGMSLAAWRAQLRLLHAAALLAEGRSVAEVSRSVGYQTPSAFSAAFRRATGRAPSAFGHAARRSHDRA